MNNLKFKRGLVSLKDIIDQVKKLELGNGVSFTDLNCCFIKNKLLTFGRVGDAQWNSDEYTEITEGEFMKLASL